MSAHQSLPLPMHHPLPSAFRFCLTRPRPPRGFDATVTLSYVHHFERQFENLHPKRRPLLLAPRNECGMRKFICTSLRPTQLPYQDLYDYDKCARFVADFMSYEPLELATSLPQHMPSPSACISWQAGDCFDLAHLLASLLLGVGYDAYVVSGYARVACTCCDQSATTYLVDGGKVEKAAEAAATQQKYAVPPRTYLESNFVKVRTERETTSKDNMLAPLSAQQITNQDLQTLCSMYR